MAAPRNPAACRATRNRLRRPRLQRPLALLALVLTAAACTRVSGRFIQHRRTSSDGGDAAEGETNPNEVHTAASYGEALDRCRYYEPLFESIHDSLKW